MSKHKQLPHQHLTEHADYPAWPSFFKDFKRTRIEGRVYDCECLHPKMEGTSLIGKYGSIRPTKKVEQGPVEDDVVGTKEPIPSASMVRGGRVNI